MHGELPSCVTEADFLHGLVPLVSPPSGLMDGLVYAPFEALLPFDNGKLCDFIARLSPANGVGSRRFVQLSTEARPYGKMCAHGVLLLPEEDAAAFQRDPKRLHESVHRVGESQVVEPDPFDYKHMGSEHAVSFRAVRSAGGQFERVVRALMLEGLPPVLVASGERELVSSKEDRDADVWLRFVKPPMNALAIRQLVERIGPQLKTHGIAELCYHYPIEPLVQIHRC